MKKLTLKEKIEVLIKVRKSLREGGCNFLCNKLADKADFLWESPRYRNEFIKLNFNELYEYKPEEIIDKTSSWFESGKIKERTLIMDDMIYRFTAALAQKKPVSGIKSKYVPLPYHY